MADESNPVVSDDPVSTTATHSTATVTTTESETGYPTFFQKINSLEYITLMLFIFIPLGVAAFKSYAWVDQFLFGMASMALAALLGKFGYRSGEKKTGGGK